jgi:hypothetical protein
MKCTAQDAQRLRADCKPSEGKHDGKTQFYCAHCGRKMNPPDQGAM